MKGLKEVPRHLSPGKIFLVVGRIRDGESVSRRYLSHLMGIVSQGSDDCQVSTVVLPGPVFEYAQELQGHQLARDPTVDKVIWMRWNFPEAA